LVSQLWPDVWEVYVKGQDWLPGGYHPLGRCLIGGEAAGCGNFMFLISLAEVAFASLPYCHVVRYPSLELGKWHISLSEVSGAYGTRCVVGELRCNVVPVFCAQRSCLGTCAGIDPFPVRVWLTQWLSAIHVV
jgi:hypothetical protein